MIRKESFTLDGDAFAAQRRDILNRADEELKDPATWSVLRFGLPGWEENLVDAALKVFTKTAEAEVDEWSQVLDDLRGTFEMELRETLKKTKRSDNPDAQMQSLVRWVSTMSINAATEAAATADPDENVGLEWVTMGDTAVRESHQHANGQTVPSGQPFTVDGEELLYPGQPIGDPSVWYNCRCVARPTMLTSALTAAAEVTDVGQSSVVVALPATTDPINAVSSEEDGAHVTLLFLGDASAFDPRPILDVLAMAAEQVGVPVTDAINGSAVLGEHKADVALIDAKHLANIRGVILATDDVRAIHDGVEQFPTWIPHLTLGYPETPRLSGDIPAEITFDRLALWHGTQKTEFNLADKPIESMVAAVETEEEITPLPVEDEEVPEGSIDPAEFDMVPWHGVLCPESALSGDNRMFAENSMVNRPLPLPLTYQPKSMAEHGGSVIVGRIDRIFREGGLIKAEGVFDNSEIGYEVIRLLANAMVRGVSVELDAITGEITEDGTTQVTTSGRITAATIVQTPAFVEAWVALGHWDDEAIESELATEADELEPSGNPGTFASVPRKTKDGPGWITNPGDTKRITDYWVDGRGAAKIGWGAPGDFDRCRVNLAKYVQNPEWLAGLCANLHYRALRSWPGAHTIVTSGLEDVSKEDMALVASAVMAEAEVAVSADWFRDPDLDGPTPLTITDEGRVYGHLARWDTCHIGSVDRDGGCVTAPPSATNYAYFLTGEVVTDAGRVAVGQISMGAGHANEKQGIRAAAAHYDSTSASVADVTAGEDDHGIWVAGAIREGVEPREVRKLMASTLSGDWRRVVVGGRGSLELVAALAVNVPGFPTPRTRFSSTPMGQMSLTAAGVLQAAPSIDSDKTAKLSASRAVFRQMRVAAARSRINK